MATAREAPSRAFEGWIPLGLVCLGAFPAFAGVVRLASFAQGGPTLPDAERFASHPGALAVHVAAGLLYTLLGAIQFAPALRRRRPALHRIAGRIVAPAGLAAGLSGLWTMLAYPASPTAGLPIHAMRVVAAASMITFLVAGLAALTRRDFRAHGAWMTRAYAIGIAGGTQALMLAPLTLLFGVDTEATFTVGMALGWLVNLGAAERIVRRRRSRAAATREPRASARAHTCAEPMKAIAYERYGSPDELHFARVPRPSPGPGQVLVRVEATSLNAVDRRMLRADPFLVRLANGIVRPRARILGADVAGVIEAVGPGVRARSVGERVFGESSNEGLGAFAEYVCLRESSVAAIPTGLDALSAAALPLAASTALQAVRECARVQAGQRVLVYGAGGGVGGYLVQIAKAFGATVTAVCGPRSVASLRALGADDVLDRTRLRALETRARFDVVFGVNGYRPLARYIDLLASGGIYVMVGGDGRQIFEALVLGALRARSGGRRVKVLNMDASLASRDLEELRALVARGALRPVVDRVMPLAQAARAMRVLEEGHVRGKIVLDARAFAARVDAPAHEAAQ
ncbi:MAG: DUF2306 domain-containing protein [Labilithrix sp.]|nr:DUF2306 domain-containing protein [Labilithrix sp.]